MSGAKHTPGPWVVEGEHRPIRDVMHWCGEVLPGRHDSEPYRGPIAQITSCNHIDGISEAEAEANASLIASAPETAAQRDDLVAAADQVRRVFGAPGDYGYGTPKGDALFALYRAAVKGGAS